MIVRITTEGQYRLDDGRVQELNELDNEAVAAVHAGEEARFVDLFARMLELVRTYGEIVPDEELTGSDVILPPPDTTFEHAREEFTGEGLIPG